jgi:uncharacterized membrane protein
MIERQGMERKLWYYKNLLSMVIILFMCLLFVYPVFADNYEYFPTRVTLVESPHINNKGVIAGKACDKSIVSENDCETTGFTYSNGTYTSINLPSQYDDAYINGFNNDGIIIGYGHNSTTGNHDGFIYSNGTYAIFENTAFNGINDNGVILGRSSSGAFTYSNGAYTYINQPSSSDIRNLLYKGINNDGVIVGWGEKWNPVYGGAVGFTYSNGNYTYIDLPSGYIYGEFTGINDSGVIAGDIFDPAPENEHTRSFTYSNGTFTIIDLPSGSIFGSSNAFSINNEGVVAGEIWKDDGTDNYRTYYGMYTYNNGNYNIVLPDRARPTVPEPATMLLLGLGLMGVAGVRRKMKK